MRGMGLQRSDELIAEFLATEKSVVRRPRWRTGRHPDYGSLSLLVEVNGKRHLRGRVIVAAHRKMLPPKYCLSLLFRRERLLGLDVNPRRFHRNLLAGGSVSVTHWQRWPAMEAEPDDRERPFAVWLHEFLVCARVMCNYRIAPPPRVPGQQLDLLNGK
jgi:hypothetical protein